MLNILIFFRIIQALNWVGERGLILLIVSFSTVYNLPRFFELEVKVRKNKQDIFWITKYKFVVNFLFFLFFLCWTILYEI